MAAVVLLQVRLYFLSLVDIPNFPVGLQKMPEEEAFAVLVKIMYNYGHRDVFKANFQNLHLMFYQLDRLLEVSELCTPTTSCSLYIHIHSTCASIYVHTGRTVNFEKREGRKEEEKE